MKRLALWCALALALAGAALADARAATPAAASVRLAADDGPAVDADYVYDQLAYLSMHFLRREAGYDTHLAPGQNGHDEFADYWAQEALRDLQGFGATARRDPFAVSGWDSIPAPVDAFNVEVTVPGAQHPDQVVVVGCHYDGEHDSSQSAYDDASGCAIELGVARALAGYWRARGLAPARTLRFVLFDGEEQGVRGSFHYLNQTIAGELGDVVAMFNEEQSGIAYPLRFRGEAANPFLPLHVQLAPLADNEFYADRHALPPAQRDRLARFRELMRAALPASFLRLQRDGHLWLTYHSDGGTPVVQPVFTPDQMSNVEYLDDYQGGSDQVPFTEAGIPAATLSGNNTYYSDAPDPWSYPFDQPDDTIQLMNTYAGGTPAKSASLALALALPGTITTWMLQQPEVVGAVPRGADPAASVGDVGRLVPGDDAAFGAVAYAPGGGPLTYAWDFGDGAAASGASVHHAYASAGTYPLTLTVSSPSGTRQVRKTIRVAADWPALPNRYAAWPHSGAPPHNPLVTFPALGAPVPGASATPSPTPANDTHGEHPAARPRPGGLGGVAALGLLLAAGCVCAVWMFRRRAILRPRAK